MKVTECSALTHKQAQQTHLPQWHLQALVTRATRTPRQNLQPIQNHIRSNNLNMMPCHIKQLREEAIIPPTDIPEFEHFAHKLPQIVQDFRTGPTCHAGSIKPPNPPQDTGHQHHQAELVSLQKQVTELQAQLMAQTTAQQDQANCQTGTPCYDIPDQTSDSHHAPMDTLSREHSNAFQSQDARYAASAPQSHNPYNIDNLRTQHDHPILYSHQAYRNVSYDAPFRESTTRHHGEEFSRPQHHNSRSSRYDIPDHDDQYY